MTSVHFIVSRTDLGEGMAMTGREMREARRRFGLTQQQLADRLGCTRFYVCRLEQRIEIPRIYALAMTAVIAQEGRQLEAA